MKELSAVVVGLQNPREKVWGILISVAASGITLRGIDLNSFDDWSRGVARGDKDMGLSTTFFPIHRVERVNLDETVGSVLSLAETFEARAGRDVWSFLGLPRGLPADGYAPEKATGGWLTLAAAEREHIERVLVGSAWDRAAAAEILGVTEEALEAKLAAHGLRPPS